MSKRCLKDVPMLSLLERREVSCRVKIASGSARGLIVRGNKNLCAKYLNSLRQYVTPFLTIVKYCSILWTLTSYKRGNWKMRFSSETITNIQSEEVVLKTKDHWGKLKQINFHSILEFSSLFSTYLCQILSRIFEILYLDIS